MTLTNLVLADNSSPLTPCEPIAKAAAEEVFSKFTVTATIPGGNCASRTELPTDKTNGVSEACSETSKIKSIDALGGRLSLNVTLVLLPHAQALDSKI